MGDTCEFTEPVAETLASAKARLATFPLLELLIWMIGSRQQFGKGLISSLRRVLEEPGGWEGPLSSWTDCFDICALESSTAFCAVLEIDSSQLHFMALNLSAYGYLLRALKCGIDRPIFSCSRNCVPPILRNFAEAIVGHREFLSLDDLQVWLGFIELQLANSLCESTLVWMLEEVLSLLAHHLPDVVTSEPPATIAQDPPFWHLASCLADGLLSSEADVRSPFLSVLRSKPGLFFVWITAMHHIFRLSSPKYLEKWLHKFVHTNRFLVHGIEFANELRKSCLPIRGCGGRSRDAGDGRCLCWILSYALTNA